MTTLLNESSTIIPTQHHNEMVSVILVSGVVMLLSVVISMMQKMSLKDDDNNTHMSNSSFSLSRWTRIYFLVPFLKQRRKCINLIHLRQRESTLLPKLSNRYLYSLLCSVFLQQLLYQPTSAYVYVENNTYASLPALFGRFLVDGKTYEARLQYFHENPYLCDIDDKTISHFVPPTGGVQINHFGGSNLTLYEESVALLVIRGNCPFQRKAQIAEYIDDSVKLLLIANFNLDNVPQDDETLVPMISQYGDTRLVLLSISHATGQALKKYLSEQPANITEIGGPIIQFDSTPPDGLLTEQDLQSMMLSALGLFFMLISFTGCLVILTGTYHQLQNQQNGGSANPITAATQRRLLTEEEVQQFSLTTDTTPDVETTSSNLKISQSPRVLTNNGLNDDDDIDLDGADDDQCAVCLGDFDDDTTLSVLPCQHKFHTSCITPWLTERQSKCPLCKFDVLQHIRDQASSNPTSENNSADTHDPTNDRAVTPASVSFWDQLCRYRWTSVDTQFHDDDNIQQLDGIMRVVEALSMHDLDLDYIYPNGIDNHPPSFADGFELTERRPQSLS